MESREKLKNARNLLLKLHKSLLDREREVYENTNGPLNSGEFLNLLLEDLQFAWLRKFSILIVEIDEMFDLKDGISAEMIDANLVKIKELVEMKDFEENFRAKYEAGIQHNSDAASRQGELKAMLRE
jgi:hypothetical protein